MKRIKSLGDLLKEGVLGARGETDTFSALEIFETAKLIERKEEIFYKNAKALCKESELRDLYSQLEAWRAKQVKKISHIREMYSERTGEFFQITRDEQPNVAGMMASLAIFTNRPFLVEGKDVSEKKEKILLDAIRRGKEAIIYYSGLRDFAGDSEGKKIIDKIIGSENIYIETLNKQLAETKK
ncbi:MAG: hypothetical protein ACYSSP_00115 [Planctomycetota bacterium]|jgi:hypothetical protein